MTEAIRDTWYMVGRQARNLMREPIWIALILIQPLVWLLLYGQLFKRITHLPGGGFGTTSYITFLAPAIVVMNAFFGATWSGMAMISDLDRDVIPRFLATPVSRVSLVASQVVRSSLTAMIQALIILLIALALGVRIDAGAEGWLIILLSAALVSSAFAGLSQAIALLTRREATMIAVANFIGLPLLFLSTTLISLRQIPEWMREAARYNPVNWGVDAARQVAIPGTDWGSVGTHLGLLFALTIVMAALATWTFRVYQRSL
jgi:ABC-2 type transport system permease protein